MADPRRKRRWEADELLGRDQPSMAMYGRKPSPKKSGTVTTPGRWIFRPGKPEVAGVRSKPRGGRMHMVTASPNFGGRHMVNEARYIEPADPHNVPGDVLTFEREATALATMPSLKFKSGSKMPQINPNEFWKRSLGPNRRMYQAGLRWT